MKLIAGLFLLLGACSASPSAPVKNESDDSFLDCLAGLGKDQSKGYASCASATEPHYRPPVAPSPVRR